MDTLTTHPVFNVAHYAGTMPDKIRRSLALGPRYYARDVPRYWFERWRGTPSAGPWDWEVLWSPLQEFGLLHREPHVLPPDIGVILDQINAVGLKIALPPERFLAICAQWWRVAHREGAVIECGSFQGTTGLALALLGERLGAPQDVHMFDLFGLPADIDFQSVDGERQDNEFAVERDFTDKFQEMAKTLDIADRITLHQGLFEKTFPAFLAEKKICKFAHVDANVYASTREACGLLTSVMADQAIVIFDDYHAVTDLGARLAIDQCFRSQQGKPQRLRGTSAMMIYKRPPGGNVTAR